MIEFYWAWIGGPVARFLGPWVDSVSYPLSEGLLLLSISLVLLRLILPMLGFQMPGIWWVGPILLSIMAFSQGVTPIDWVPSVFRDRPHQRAGTEAVDGKILEWKKMAQERVLKFSEETYRSTEESPDLKEVHRAVTRVLNGLSYPPGREVTRVKDMVGLTRIMGLAYGGPAYHDVVTGEVVMASNRDLPRTKVSRWLTVVHEIAHAQGFTNEMDAEVLTWLILREMESPFAYFCADLQALSKGQWKWKGPEVYEEDRDKVIGARKKLHQPWVKALRSFWEKAGLQNSGEKYGVVREEIPRSNHPFFGVVMKWDRLPSSDIK